MNKIRFLFYHLIYILGNYPFRKPSALTKIGLWKLCLMFDSLWGMCDWVGRFTPVFSSSIGGCNRMKTTPFFPLGRGRHMLLVVNLFLAIGLTVLSFRYVQPKDCYRVCGVEEGMSCLPGGCRFGEQKAGWPIPVFVDAPGGGSPTGGWGLLGPEDLPLVVPMILD